MFAEKHGYCTHPHYNRWNNIHQWCYNKRCKDYSRLGGVGIEVDAEWSKDNPKGMENFINWLEEELKQHPEINPKRFNLGRRDKTKNFGPANCMLCTQAESVQARKSAPLTAEKVVEARRYKKAHPQTTLKELSKMFGVAEGTMSELLRGVQWANVNDIEPPLPKFFGL